MQTLRQSKLWAALLLGFALFAICSCKNNCRGPENAKEHPRIISHLPSFTEIALALGLEDSLVGVSDYCKLPPGSKVARLGGQINPDIERAISLAPTLVLLPDSQSILKSKYKRLGVQTMVGGLDTIADLFFAIESIGRATGKQEQATELSTKLKYNLEQIRNTAKKNKIISTLVVIGHEPGSLREIYVAGGGSWHSELLTIAGGRNIFGEIQIPYPKVSKEEILSRDPEVIILISDHSGFTLESLEAERKLWSEFSYLDAVKKERIYLIEGDFAFVPGPRIDLLAAELQQLLFGNNS
jgi:cobalamin transport system substrate-binding protein